jgi:uncharacterized protein (TIGR02757 family)
MKSYLDQVLSQIDGEFIQNDPISIPHSFRCREDIEISGFFAAIFAWGRRDIIIRKTNELMLLMNNEPYQFIRNYTPSDFQKINGFKHRTFNSSDLDFYIRALKQVYQDHSSLESLFKGDLKAETIEGHLIHFYQTMSTIVPLESRNLKHISTPRSKSACKRLCMFLRWMVREDEIDFGIWKTIKPNQLVIPLDVHVMNVAKKYAILPENEKPSWQTAIELTNYLKKWCAEDPVKYDLALFSLGLNSRQ